MEQADERAFVAARAMSLTMVWRRPMLLSLVMICIAIVCVFGAVRLAGDNF